MKRTYKIALVTFAGVLLLTLVAAYIYFRAIGLQRMNWTKTMEGEIAKASTDYHSAFGKWPHSLEDLSNAKFFNPGVPGDGWDRPFIYRPFDSVLGYGTVISYGRDGKPGGTGADADFEVQFGK